MIYCSICGQWLKANSYIDAECIHYHKGIINYFMRCEPIQMSTNINEHVGIKPVRNYWRACLISVETGYSENPSWGHEAGGWIHYTYRAFRDNRGNYIEANDKATLIQLLKNNPNIKPDGYMHKSSIEWTKNYPLKE